MTEPTPTLEEVVANKKWELRSRAEDAWWAAFYSDDQLPIMNAFKILIVIATSRRPLRQGETTAMNNAMLVSQKLETKIAAVNTAAATGSIPNVQAITWDN